MPNTPDSSKEGRNSNPLNFLREVLIGATYFIKRVRVLIIAVVFAFLLFALPDQTLELYSELTQHLERFPIRMHHIRR